LTAGSFPLRSCERGSDFYSPTGIDREFIPKFLKTVDAIKLLPMQKKECHSEDTTWKDYGKTEVSGEEKRGLLPRKPILRG